MTKKLQIIDLQKTNSTKEIIYSLKEYGFAVIVNHDINKELIEDNFKSWKSFFNSSEKYNYSYDEKKYEGYFSSDKVEIPIGNKTRDFKEFSHFYHDNYPENVKKTHSLLFNKTTNIFYEILNNIEFELPKNVKKNFSMPLVNMIKNNQKNCLRVNHYPPIIDNNRVRAGAHIDISFMTLLMTDQNSGLEVLSKNNKWIPIPTEYNSIVINIGEQMELLTEGFFKATYHRVINPENNNNVSRYSMPLFLHVYNELKLNNEFTTEEYLLDRSKKSGFKHSKE